MLIVEDLYVGYQNFDILQGVNLQVNSGEIVCVIGPNGVGKSTVFKAIYGLLKIRRGKVVFDGKDITDLKPQQRLQAGMTIIPQLRSIFPKMSVRENLELGMYLEKDLNRIEKRIEYIFELFPQLKQLQAQLAGTMSGGEQRLLEIGRALLLEPKMIMMDEPSAGLAPQTAQLIFRTIQTLNQEIGLTVLMIEQNVRQGLDISHRGYVLDLGTNLFEGTASDILQNPAVCRAFLGA